MSILSEERPLELDNNKKNATECNKMPHIYEVRHHYGNVLKLSSTPPKITYEPPPYVIPANAGIQ